MILFSSENLPHRRSQSAFVHVNYLNIFLREACLSRISEVREPHAVSSRVVVISAICLHGVLFD
jgi:hypothetical protein